MPDDLDVQEFFDPFVKEEEVFQFVGDLLQVAPPIQPPPVPAKVPLKVNKNLDLEDPQDRLKVLLGVAPKLPKLKKNPFDVKRAKNLDMPRKNKGAKENVDMWRPPLNNDPLVGDGMIRGLDVFVPLEDDVKARDLIQYEAMMPPLADPEPEVPQPQGPPLPPSERKSMFGNVFSNSIEADWGVLDGLPGQYHIVKEEKLIPENYAQCVVTNKWFKRQHGSSTVDGKRISPMGVEILKKDKTYHKCMASGRWTNLENDILEVYDGDKKLAKVSLYAMARDLGPTPVYCDYYKAKFLPQSVCRVTNSEQYRFISVHALKNTDLFQNCPSCKNLYEKIMVEERPKLGGQILCVRCYRKQINANVILKYNDKHYPAPIAAATVHLGYKVGKDGLIYATNKKMWTPVVRLFGVEAEVELHYEGARKEAMDRIDFASAIKEVLGEDFAITKEDGTLLANGKYDGTEKGPHGDTGSLYAGFEIVTAPCDFVTQKERWNRLPAAKGFKHLRAWDTKTCGFHVHVSRESITSLQLGRILMWVNNPANQEFVQTVAGRKKHRWCRYYKKEFSDALHPERVISPEEQETYHRGRRVAVNLSNDKTVEFRIFRGTINPNHIIRNIEFVDAVCDYCYPGARSLQEFQTHEGFLAFVSQNRKKWKMLAEWFAYHKMIKLPRLSKLADKGKATLRPDNVEEAELAA